MSNRRTAAELAAAPEGYAWCSGEKHRCLLPVDRFSRYGQRGLQKQCKDCHREYMRRWRRHGLPAKQREAYDAQQAQVEGPMTALARKYANR